MLILGASLRLASFTGLLGAPPSDDTVYAELAHAVATGDFHQVTDYPGPAAFATRLGIIIPTALAFLTAGVSETTLVLYPFVVSMLNIVLAFVAGRMFFGERAGVLAGLLATFLPMDVRLATVLLPDAAAALWANSAILLLYRGSGQPHSRAKAVHGFIAGLALGASWLCKETVLFSLPFLGLYAVWSVYQVRRNAVLAVMTAIGFGGVLAAEALLYYVYTSDALHHFHAIERHNLSPVAQVWFWNPEAPWSALLGRLLKDGPKAIFLQPQLGLLPAIAALAVAYAALRRSPSSLFVMAWFAYHVVVFNFGSHSLRSYRPLPIDGWPRYLEPLLLPAVLLGSALLDSLLFTRGRARRPLRAERLFWGGALAVVLMTGYAHAIYRNLRDGDPSHVERAIARMLAPSTVIYTDAQTAWLLRFFWAYPAGPATVDFSGVGAEAIPSGAYVLVSPRRVEMLLPYGYKPPAFADGPPGGNWRLQWQGKQARLYAVR